MPSPPENPTVHLGVQSLHSPPEHLRVTSELLDRLNDDAGFGECRSGSTGRDDFNTEQLQASSKLGKAGFVTDAHERPSNIHDVLRNVLECD